MVELTHDSRPIIGRGPPLVATFITLAAVSIGLMVADQRYHQIDQVREWLSAAIYPVQRAVDFPFRASSWVSGSFADRGRLRQENLELTARLRLANLQLQRFAALEDENRRLREMREKTGGVTEKVLVASILNVDLDPFRHRVLVDKGALDKVFKGQAVLDGDGIFGQVTKVNAGTAEVILISDPEHAIPVQSNRSGVRTIAVGTGDSNKLSLPFVTVEADLQVGDLLLSTGLGGVFPPGYPVAEVTQVKRAGSTFALVEARPTAQLDRDREVLLAWFTPLVTEAALAPAPAVPAAKPAQGRTPTPPRTPGAARPAPQATASPAGSATRTPNVTAGARAGAAATSAAPPATPPTAAAEPQNRPAASAEATRAPAVEAPPAEAGE